ncbi:MAG: hypothetical protein CMN32_07920 [Saprospirales bacterium]|nr:hypothetical protein [Saprospirales bacterium]
MPYRNTAAFRINSIMGLLVMVGFFIALFYLMRGIFIILTWVAPVLLIAAFIIRKSVVINYGKWLLSTLKSNPLMGILAILLTVVGYMVVFPYLFLKALFVKKVDDLQQEHIRQTQGDLVDFEELDSQIFDEDGGFVELPPAGQSGKTKDSDYQELFD